MMFSLFTNKQEILGLDITEDRIRYVKVSKSRNKIRLLSYGEERVGSVEPRNALMFALMNIKSRTKTKNAVISLPEDVARFEIVSIKRAGEKALIENLRFRLVEKCLIENGEDVLYCEKQSSVGDRIYYKVLISTKDNVRFFKTVFDNAGIKVLGFKSRGDALLSSFSNSELLAPSIILNCEPDFTDAVIHYPLEDIKEIPLIVPKEKIANSINEILIDFYKETNEKIGHIFVSGSLACDSSFMNNLSRSTRLSVDEASPLSKFYFNRNEVPSMTKKESLLFAIALGLCTI